MTDIKKNFYRASASDFQKIPGSPIAYWVSNKVREAFDILPSIRNISELREGIHTGKNEVFVKNWFEVSRGKISFSPFGYIKSDTQVRYVPYNKGGPYRKWYGNNESIITWDKLSQDKMKQLKGHVRPSQHLYFKESIEWSLISSSYFGARYSPSSHLNDVASHYLVNDDKSIFLDSLSFLTSKVCFYFLNLLNPTLNFSSGVVNKLPFVKCVNVGASANKNITLSSSDWNMYERSWDFTSQPLLLKDESGNKKHGKNVETAYNSLHSGWQAMTDEMQRLEESNNRIFIEAYGLEDELTPEVPIEEITLTCNPAYRYGTKSSEQEREERLLTDTMKEFISYAVGCMFGRYSLDNPGLILANQGETLADYIDKVNMPLDAIQFMPDDDNVIPITEGEYFTDDITVRFCEFLKVTFGEENFNQNLSFIENAIGKKLRKYFVSDFYEHHSRMYKKRPIYWMFSSPKKSFNVLIYMHRYQPDTVSVILNDYLREFEDKLTGQKKLHQQTLVSATAPDRDKRNAQKEIDKIDKIMRELEEYERDVIYPLATQKLEIDLDDGVKVNYNKFGKALRKITGLSGK